MTQKNELELVAAIDARMGEIVQLANKIIDEVIPKAGKIELVMATQLRNLLAIANASPHPLVLTSFIGYQMGRQTTSKVWRDTGLGEGLMKAIDGDVQRWAGEAAGGKDSPEVQMRMARLLLGFMSRRWVYRRAQEPHRREK